MARMFYKDAELTKEMTLRLKAKKKLKVRNKFYKYGFWILWTVLMATALHDNWELVNAYVQRLFNY